MCTRVLYTDVDEDDVYCESCKNSRFLSFLARQNTRELHLSRDMKSPKTFIVLLCVLSSAYIYYM